MSCKFASRTSDYRLPPQEVLDQDFESVYRVLVQRNRTNRIWVVSEFRVRREFALSKQSPINTVCVYEVWQFLEALPLPKIRTDESGRVAPDTRSLQLDETCEQSVR